MHVKYSFSESNKVINVSYSIYRCGDMRVQFVFAVQHTKLSRALASRGGR